MGMERVCDSLGWRTYWQITTASVEAKRRYFFLFRPDGMQDVVCRAKR